MAALHRPRRLLTDVLTRGRRRLLLPVVGVGVVGGLVGAAYVGALHLLQRALWPSHHDPWTQLAILTTAGAGAALLTKVLGSPGDVELLVDNIHVSGGAEGTRELRSLIPISLLCIASGGGMGPEAPLVQTTGTLGSWVARRRRLRTEHTRVLTITGMAAGFTVLFGAPLGSAFFALEILHRRGLEYYEALVPSLLGALSGYGVYVGLTGLGLEPVWRFPAAGRLHPVDLGWAALAGLGGTVIAVTFTSLNQSLRWTFRRLPASLRPVLGGVGLGLLGLGTPYALTFGEGQVVPMLRHHPEVAFLAVVLVAKLAATSLTLSSGWRGGFIIPLFFMGATLGRLGHLVLPHTNEVVLVSATMAAACIGVTKTLIGSTLVVTEMAGLQLLPTTLVAGLLALFLTSNVGLIESQRARETMLDDAESPAA